MQPKPKLKPWAIGLLVITVPVFSLILILDGESADDSQSVLKLNPATQQIKQTDAEDQLPSSEKQMPLVERHSPEEENPFLGNEVKARLVQVRDQFAEDIKYPAFSKPIRNENELIKYLPNRSFAAETPIDFDDDSSPSIRLEAEKHRYFGNEPIIALASISGLQDNEYSRVNARLVSNGEVIFSSAKVSRQEDQAHSYSLKFSGIDGYSQRKNLSMMIIAQFNIYGVDYEVATPIAYSQTIASVTGLDDVSVKGEYLEIPVKIETDEPGWHKVAGNLYDKDTGEALVHLSGKSEVTSSSGQVLLRAHVAALKLKGQEGPYVLRDVSLVRMPSAPTFITQHGIVELDELQVTGFPFSEYEDVPYQDERAQQRLDFLAKIGGTD